MRVFDESALNKAVSKMLGKAVTCSDYRTKELEGGSIGNTLLIEGTAQDCSGEAALFKVVLKFTSNWGRELDPDSWRREFDLYMSELDSVFSGSFRWPKCYYSEIGDKENQLWLEYIEGVSGLSLTLDMFERTARELGRFQGKLYAEQPAFLQNIANLSKVDDLKNHYQAYKSWNIIHDCIHSEKSEIPEHLRKMLINVEENTDEIFSRIEKLPVVLCHRDFWAENIFHTESGIIAIDWDTVGWGYMGEDLASLISDDVPLKITEYYQKCVPAYYEGFLEKADISHIKDYCIYDLIRVMFGHKIVNWFLHEAESPEEKKRYIDWLQEIYEIN